MENTDIMVNPTLLTQTSVLSRQGWTKTLLRSILGEPDELRKMLGRSNLACLYAEPRVIAAEASPEFAVAQDLIAKRKLSAQIAVQTKITKLLAAVESMPVSVRLMELKKLKIAAIHAYNEHNWRSDNPADLNSDALFLERICVNYIRHSLTDYDHALEVMAGKVGGGVAVRRLRGRIFQEIEKAYPLFAWECQRQRYH